MTLSITIVAIDQNSDGTFNVDAGIDRAKDQPRAKMSLTALTSAEVSGLAVDGRYIVTIS